ncbi:MAG: tRNA-intron lyase [Nanoarchaeota archaeon]|nr:tRNA-intron lyase [Nanoarchaeota archaeon]
MVKVNKSKKQSISEKRKIKAVLSAGRVTSNTSDAFQMHESGRFGEKVEGKIQYSLVEALYLMNKDRLEVLQKKKKIKSEKFIELACEKESNFMAKYPVFRDLRDRGYIVKTALKFGADFRVYNKGVKPGEDHAKWIVFPVYESSVMTWHDFAAKNRVAHSTKKNLLIAIVDDEGDVTYYECRWIRP